MTLEYIITSAVSALNNHVQSIHGNAACISLRVLAGWGSSAFVCCVEAARRKIDFFLRSWIVLIFYFLIMSGRTGLWWGSGCILTSLLVTAGIDSCTPTLLIWEKMDGWMSCAVRVFIYHISTKRCAASQADSLTESFRWMMASKGMCVRAGVRVVLRLREFELELGLGKG